MLEVMIETITEIFGISGFVCPVIHDKEKKKNCIGITLFHFWKVRPVILHK